jgi:hypothetical protein
MLRVLAALTLLTVGGLLFAMEAAYDGADAHPVAARPAVAAKHDRADPRPPAAPLPSTRKSDTTAPVLSSTTASRSGERSFLLRPAGPPVEPASGQLPPEQRGTQTEAVSQGTPGPKVLVERAPAPPAIIEPAPKRLASAENPGPNVSSIGGAARLDLNTASAEELNRAGGGMIGKAIVRQRPYADPEDLLRKRVVSRATFERIKAHVAVR